MPSKGKRKETPKPPLKANDAQKNTPSLILPSWPPLKPLIPHSDLSLQEILQGQIVTIPSLWTSSLCKNYVSFLSNLPLTTTPGKPKKGDAVRVNDRFQINDAAFAERLWSETALKSLILGLNGENELVKTPGDVRNLWGGDVIGLNPNIRIYRYKKGQFFDQHYDDFNNVTIPNEPPLLARTTWTLLLYLTSPATGCYGGQTVFYPDPDNSKKTSGKKVAPPEPIVVELETGMALLHKHGTDCMLHEGREVQEGEKWVIRSDICVRR